MKYSIGIYVLENSVKLVMIDQEGNVSGRADGEFHRDETGIDPGVVWEAVSSGIKDLTAAAGVNPEEIISLGVTSPAGWVLPADSRGDALGTLVPGIDGRVSGEVKTINEKCENLINSTGFRFDESSALAKILWLRNNLPDIYKKTRRFLHIADFINSKFTGAAFYATDTSHALGMGFDTSKSGWHRCLRDLGIRPDYFPEVVAPGRTIGTVDAGRAKDLGLSAGTGVSAGTIDEMCLLFSSGAVSYGQWNSHLGEQLIVRGGTQNILTDRLRRIHYHAHPAGRWIACGRSCTGTNFPDDRFKDVNMRELAGGLQASNLVIYPLCHKGPNLLPLVLGEAEGFIIGKPRDKQDLFSGYAEGAACVEKWIYELLEEMGFQVGDTICATGETGEKWLKMRADIIEKTFVAPAEPTAEFGIAVLGLSGTLYGDIREAVGAAVRHSMRFEPETTKHYRSKYRKFRQACKAIGYE